MKDHSSTGGKQSHDHFSAATATTSLNQLIKRANIGLLNSQRNPTQAIQSIQSRGRRIVECQLVIFFVDRYNYTEHNLESSKSDFSSKTAT
uniref:Uncharacterized protein n=1 Tax=Kalanchoe fedtschenkoi TaxID=63787 RepID=A0A7N1A8Q6_KALFE